MEEAIGAVEIHADSGQGRATAGEGQAAAGSFGTPGPNARSVDGCSWFLRGTAVDTGPVARPVVFVEAVADSVVQPAGLQRLGIAAHPRCLLPALPSQPYTRLGERSAHSQEGLGDVEVLSTGCCARFFLENIEGIAMRGRVELSQMAGKYSGRRQRWPKLRITTATGCNGISGTLNQERRL